MFNWVYDTRCYLPLTGFLSFDGEAEQYLVAYVLRAGNALAKQGLLSVLDRLLPRLRAAFPKARLRIRLDAGFTGTELYDYFEQQGLEYVVCMAKNPVLQANAEPLLEPLREAVAAGEVAQAAFSECAYRAQTWTRTRRVIIKADIALHPGRKPKDNPRFLVTNIKGAPRQIYEQIYCARGDVENRIKELKDGLAIDRTSCTSFVANQFRALITAAAYVLMQELRLQARRPPVPRRRSAHCGCGCSSSVPVSNSRFDVLSSICRYIRRTLTPGIASLDRSAPSQPDCSAAAQDSHHRGCSRGCRLPKNHEKRLTGQLFSPNPTCRGQICAKQPSQLPLCSSPTAQTRQIRTLHE